jgi:16S rRNA (cytidine1402-2'-O)-methyltransferase
MPGTLYVVATPVGNLEDITYRAVRILREVDAIACEDTRHTRHLLDHYDITKPLISYHEHNEAARAAELVERLRGGENIALVSDAGTPLVSDPGYRLVTLAIASGISVTPVPGPSAAAAALSASGLPCDQFRFLGFLPAKTSQRRRLLESLREETATIICYEAPHRIVDSLADIVDVMGDRPAVVARELTKVHEEFLRGNAGELLRTLRERPAVKGEITLLIGRSTSTITRPVTDLPALVAELMAAGVERMDAIKRAASKLGISKREAYRMLASRPQNSRRTQQ